VNAEALIESEEGRRRIGYYDTRGVPTNGIGHTGKDVRVGVEVSDAQVDTWFAEDYATALRGVTAVLDWFPRLDPVRQAYIISMGVPDGCQRASDIPPIPGRGARRTMGCGCRRDARKRLGQADPRKGPARGACHRNW
jgi:hypothetical protein